MEKSFIYKFLIDPITGEGLEPDETGKLLKSKSGSSVYDIIDSVLKIIAGDNPSATRTELHYNQHSEFHYHDHYQKDAILFDYSEEDESPASKHEIRRLHESVIKEIKKEPSLILDAGCGNGWAAAALIPYGHKVVSMDISVKNPTDSVKRTSHQNHAGVISDVFNMPFREETFDYIIAAEIMEHVADPSLFVLSLLKVLKKGGKLIITTPYDEKIEYCLCIHCNRMTPRHAHLHSFNEKNITGFIPESAVAFKAEKLSNKYLVKLKSHIILKKLPFGIWLFIDKIFIKLSGNALRLKSVIIKN